MKFWKTLFITYCVRVVFGSDSRLFRGKLRRDEFYQILHRRLTWKVVILSHLNTYVFNFDTKNIIIFLANIAP